MCCYKALSAQKQENTAILWSFDVIGGYLDPAPGIFEKFKVGKNCYFKNVLYFGELYCFGGAGVTSYRFMGPG